MSEHPQNHLPSTDDPAVGYGQPPTHSRFQPGHSGNPRGRPRGRRNMASMVGDIMGEKILVTINGRKRRVAAEVAMILRLREQALKGDQKAINILLGLRRTYVPEAEGTPTSPHLSDEDLEILASARLPKPPEVTSGGA